MRGDFSRGVRARVAKCRGVAPCAIEKKRLPCMWNVHLYDEVRAMRIAEVLVVQVRIRVYSRCGGFSPMVIGRASCAIFELIGVICRTIAMGFLLGGHNEMNGE